MSLFSKIVECSFNLLFIELLYKINITFVIMLTFGEKKRHSSCDINYMTLYIYRLYIFCPHNLNYMGH